MLSAQSIASGYRDVMASGGMESMSRSPFLMPRFVEAPYGGVAMQDHLQHDSLIDVYTGWHMGHCAEKCARDLNVSKDEQDDYAKLSYARTKEAYAHGVLEDELAPVGVPTKKNPEAVVREDEGWFSSSSSVVIVNC